MRTKSLQNWIKACLVGMAVVALSSAALSSTSEQGDPQKVHVILDIDWTSTYSIYKNESGFFDSKAFQIGSETYRVTDHLGEVLSALITKHPDVSVSFFSGGERNRNEKILTKIILPDGRTAADIAHFVFSRSDLTAVSQDPTLGFENRFKKDIQRLIPEIDPQLTILIDDKPGFAVPPIQSVSSLGRTSFQTEFFPDRAGDEFSPRSAQMWWVERNKALVWLGALDFALEENRKTPGSFADQMVQTWQQMGIDDESRLNSPRVRELLMRGQSLVTVNQAQRVLLKPRRSNEALTIWQCRHVLMEAL